MPARLEVAVRNACLSFIDNFGMEGATRMRAAEVMFSTYYQVFLAGYQVGWAEHEQNGANLN